MPRFSANISHLFTEVAFLDRIGEAQTCGFKGVECLFPYDQTAEQICDALGNAGMAMVLFNAPPGDYAGGEVGLSALPGREKDFQDSFKVALNYAELMDCSNIHVLAAMVPEDKWDEALDVYMRNLAWAAEIAAKTNITVLIEPIVIDGYFLIRPNDAVRVVQEVSVSNLKILYDIYQAQLAQGGITDFLENHMELIGHIQVANVPGRDEPDGVGELNCRYLFDLLDANGFDGWVGAEYNPREGTKEGLRWAEDWGISGSYPPRFQSLTSSS